MVARRVFSSKLVSGSSWTSPRCRWCRRFSSSPKAATKPRRVPSASTSSFDRRFLKISPTDLSSDGDNNLFLRHEPVLNGRMLHFTSLKNKQSIDQSRAVNPGPSTSLYDQRLQFPDAPSGSYFTLQAESDKVFYPFSSNYPSSAADGDETACLSVDMSALLSNRFSMFFGGATVAPYGVALRVVSQLLFVPDRHLRFASENFIPLSKNDNSVLRWVNEVPHVATQISQSALSDGSRTRTVMNSSGDERPAAHLATIVVLDGMSIDGVAHDWHRSHRLRRKTAENSKRPPSSQCPKCFEWKAGVPILKEHYRAMHTDFRFDCPEEECDFTGNFPGSIREHVEAHHSGSEGHLCHLCASTYKHRRNLRLHILSKHPDAPVLTCPNVSPPCDFTTLIPAALDSHLETRHKPSKHTCAECSFSSDNAKVMSRHIRFAHQGGVLRCAKEGCAYTTTWQSSLFRHMQNKHGEHLISCTVDGCTHKVKRRQLLHAHFLDSHPDLVDRARGKSASQAL